jgi:hypothetical protein
VQTQFPQRPATWRSPEAASRARKEATRKRGDSTTVGQAGKPHTIENQTCKKPLVISQRSAESLARMSH